MKKCFLLIFAVILFTSCSYKVYVVRHAEKAAEPAANPELSAAGTQRALSLREVLRTKKIKRIYSTNTTRTLNTVLPLSEVINIKAEIYASRPDSALIRKIRSHPENQLVVGHSNTIDDIVNMLCGKKVVPDDLPDTAYDNLYVVKLPKSGNGSAKFRNRKYGHRTVVSGVPDKAAMTR